MSHNSTPGFESLTFADVGMATGNAPFGTTFTGSSCPTGARIRTPWPLDTDLLLRKWVDLPAGASSLVVAVAIDNDVRVYWNGEEITPGGPVPHEGCAVEDSFLFAIPNNLVTSGQNLLAVRAADRGSESFLDVEVRVEGLGAPPDERWGHCGPTEEQNTPRICRNEPVNTLTGAYTNSVRDLALPGRGLSFTLDRTYNSLNTAVSVLGPGWRHAYSSQLVFRPDGSIVLLDASGASIPFYSDGSGGYYPALGVLDVLSASGSDFVVQRRDLTTFRFNATGQLLAITDRNGNTITFSYLGSLLSSVTDTVGRTVTFAYNASSLLDAVTDSTGRSVDYTYDQAGRLETVTDLRGEVTSYGYDGNGRLATITDPNLHVLVTNIYGPGGRVAEQIDARGFHTTWAWDAPTEKSTMTDARGGTWVDDYFNGILTSQRDPLGNTTTFGYDPMLNISSVTDPRGKTTQYTSDARGNLLKSVAPAPLGYVVTYEYDHLDNLHGVRDARGAITWFDHDAMGNLVRRTDPTAGSPQTSFAYDPSGNGLLRSITNQRGKITTFGYDAQANLTSTVTPLGNRTTMTYDAAGRILTLVDPRGNAAGGVPAEYTTTFSHDAAGNLLTVTDALSHSTTNVYDPAGHRTSVIDPNTHATTFEHDPANHLTAVIDAAAKRTAYAYDQIGNLTSRTDPNLHVTTYQYDLAKRLVTETRPLARVWTYQYDSNGNLTKIIDPIAAATPSSTDYLASFVYDEVNRATTATYFGYGTVTSVFDGNDNRTSMSDPTGGASFTFDPLDRLATYRRSGRGLDYVYDAAGNLTRRTYTDGTVVDLGYDDDGRLSSMLSGGLQTNYGYDEAANLKTTVLPAANGYVDRRTYDRAGRLTEVKNEKGATILSRSTYTLDPAGNRLTTQTSTGSVTYTYDVLDRLTQACFTTACTAPGDNFRRYTYDDVANRLTEVRDTGTTTYTYDAADQLTGTTGPSGPVTYGYDLDGRQVSAGSRTFTWNAMDRVSSTILGSTTTTYLYDGAGTRMQASTGTQASKKTNYDWDPNGVLPQLVAERDGNAALMRRYKSGLDTVTLDTGGSPFYYHYDGLGSVVNLTSSTGVTQWTYDYLPYGGVRTETKNQNQAPANVLRFTGEVLDPTGLYHLRARQYDPAIGRLLGVDHAAQDLASPYVGTYSYVKDNPIRYTDPSGRCLEGLAAGLLLAVPTGGASIPVGAGETVLCAVVLGTITVVAIVASWNIGATAGKAIAESRGDPSIRPLKNVFDERPGTPLYVHNGTELGYGTPGGGSRVPSSCLGFSWKTCVALGLTGTAGGGLPFWLKENGEGIGEKP